MRSSLHSTYKRPIPSSALNEGSGQHGHISYILHGICTRPCIYHIAGNFHGGKIHGCGMPFYCVNISQIKFRRCMCTHSSAIC